LRASIRAAGARIDLVGGKLAQDIALLLFLDRSLRAASEGRHAAGRAVQRASIPAGPKPRLPACSSAVLLRFFSTTTDFDRPWLKFCRTNPCSTVRFARSTLKVCGQRQQLCLPDLSFRLIS